MDDETYRGYFWDPSNPEDRQPGFLQFAEDGSVALELINGFPIRRWELVSEGDEANGYASVDVDPPSVVLGEAGGYEFTLLGCTLRSASGFSSTPDKETLNVGRSLRGVHLASEDQKAFYGVQAEIEYLPFWAARSGIQHGYKTQGDKLLPGSTAEQQPVEPVTVSWRDLTISLRIFNSMFGFSRDATTTKVHSSERAVIQLDCDEPQQLDYWDGFVKKLQDLLTLGMAQPCGVASIMLRADDSEHPWTIWEAGKRFYMAGANPYSDPRLKALFTCHEVPFDELVPRWLGLSEQANRPISILTGMYYADGGYLETRVTTVCIALEALHRSLYDRLPMPEEDFAVIRDAALEGMSGEAKQWVNSRLHNSLSYKERAQELAARPDQEAVATLLGDAGKWAKLVRDARNGSTHDGGGRDMTAELRFRLLYVTRRLLELVLLAELGVSGEQQREVVGSTSSIWFNSDEFKKLISVKNASD